MEKHVLKNLLVGQARVAIEQTLVETGQVRRYIKQAEAFRRMGRSRVEKWSTRGTVQRYTEKENHSAVYYDRIELAAAEASDMIPM